MPEFFLRRAFGDFFVSRKTLFGILPIAGLALHRRFALTVGEGGNEHGALFGLDRRLGLEDLPQRFDAGKAHLGRLAQSVVDPGDAQPANGSRFLGPVDSVKIIQI